MSKTKFVSIFMQHTVGSSMIREKFGVENCSNAEKKNQERHAVGLLNFTKNSSEVLELDIKERNTKEFSVDLSKSVHFLEIRSTWRNVRMYFSR